MSSTAAPADARRDGAAGQVTAWWKGLATREQRLLAAAAGLVALALLWTVAVQPAWRTIRSAPVQQAALDRQWAQMQSLAAEVATLRAAPAVTPAQAQAALQSAAEQLGERARLVPGPDRATLTLTGLPPGQLGAWLVEVRRTARARPLEANLQRGPDGFSGTLVLGLGSGAAP